jgi:hypothetical protein
MAACNPLVLPPYSTDTFTACRTHTSILTYFGRIAIFFAKKLEKWLWPEMQGRNPEAKEITEEQIEL